MEDRVCLLDQIRNKEVDFDRTIKLVLDVLQEVYYHFNDFYIKSQYCVLGKTLSDAINSIVKNRGNGINEFLNFYELIDSLVYTYQINGYCGDHEVNQIEQILNLNLEKVGWVNDFNYETQQSTLRRKDLKAEIVANTQEKDVQTKIYEYLAIHDGMINEKRELLKSLIDDVEAFCKKRSSIKEIDKAKQFYQCVRHTRDEPKKEFSFYYANEEKWLDCIFQMVIDILSFEDLEKRVKTIVEEENKK